MRYNHLSSATAPEALSTQHEASTNLAAPIHKQLSVLTTASLLSQLPRIPRFNGEEEQDGEMFQDCLEWFESVVAVLSGMTIPTS